MCVGKIRNGVEAEIIGGNCPHLKSSLTLVGFFIWLNDG